MNVDCFVDTNVFIYAAAGHGIDEEWKRDRALRIMEANVFGLSAQVLAEFYVNVTRKIEYPLTRPDAIEWVDRLALQPVVPITDTLVKVAIAIAAEYQISYWDGAILAAAQSLEVTTVYTEDLNHGQLYRSVRVINPFLPA